MVKFFLSEAFFVVNLGLKMCLAPNNFKLLNITNKEKRCPGIKYFDAARLTNKNFRSHTGVLVELENGGGHLLGTC